MCLKPKMNYEELFAEFEEQEKRDALGKGLFWLVKNDSEKFELFCIKILCYRDCETLEKIETGICESEKLNHERAWAKLIKPLRKGNHTTSIRAVEWRLKKAKQRYISTLR